MARLNFLEIEPAKGKSKDLDQFEKFTKIFLESVIGGRITKGPTRGADGGIDLRLEVQEVGETVRKLISCKHFAHSKESVGIGDELDILDRLASFGCTVFVGFYSTIASAGLEQKLERLRTEKGIKFEFFNNEDIESLLLGSLPGFRVAKRFFPASIQNVWPQIISLETKYTAVDAVSSDDEKWFVPDAFESAGLVAYANTPELAALLANERAMREIHAPMFLGAWKDAVRYFPSYFVIPADGIDSATSVIELPPNWDAASQLDKLRPNPRWSLLAIWSLIDPDRVRLILKELGRDASQRRLDLMSFQWLALSTGTERRDILTRLFAYHSI
ncbi:hypothetical protein [Cupriavidus basilensis]|uniref:Restriction endonuclease n=1 Tax=Cupriavidus basilensis TaxID=68895 RepID=A0A643FXA7_9BURK|nr:hypothetical protein [Cupriavidus basilensis]QOT76562.1 hypothetical protein F7R26_000120 [Cupriavidus basilensis]